MRSIALCLLLFVLVLPLAFAAPPEGPAPKPRSEAELEKALDEPLTAAFNETPLSDVLEGLREKTSLPILIDRKALADVGIATDQAVSFFAKDSALRPALRRMLQPVDLTFVIRDEVLLITTPEEANARLFSRVYVLPKAIEAFPAAERDLHARHFAGVIEETIAPTTWTDVGGPGAMSLFRGRLLVSQVLEVHQEIAVLIDTINTIAASPAPPKGPASFAAATRHSKVEQKILAALDLPAAADFFEEPLAKAMDFLGTKADIRVEIDKKALSDVGLNGDMPVTFKLKGTSLRALLKPLLKDFDLTYVVRDDVLLITTPEEANSKLVTHLYPIADLVWFDPVPARLPPLGQQLGNRTPLVTGAEELLRMLESEVAPTTWDNVGGPGSMTAVVHPPVLVVSQTQEVQLDLADLLAKLRARLPAEPLGPPAPVERIYLLTDPLGRDTLPAIPPGELAALVEEMIEPKSWRSPDGKPAAGISLKPLPGRLIIRHRPAVHVQIEKLLLDLKVIDPDFPQKAPARNGGGVSGSGFF